MGIKFEGLPPESNDKLNRIISDNIVTGNEVQGLNAAEQEALSSLLGGKLPDVGDEVKVPKRHVGEAEDKPKKSGGNGVGIFAGIVAGCTALGAIAGGVAGFFAGGAGAVPGAAAGAKLGAGLGIFLATVSGCQVVDLTPDQRLEYEEGDVTVNVGAEFNVSVEVVEKETDPEKLYGWLKDFINEIIQKTDEKDEARHKEMMGILVAIFDRLGELEKSFSEVVNTLKAQGITLENIKNVLANGNKEILAALTTIFDAVNKGTEISTKNNALLVQLIQLVSSLDSNTDESLKNTIEQMFAMLAEAIQKGQEMDKKTYDLLLSMSNDLKNILEAVNKNSAISEDIKNLTMKVLEQINIGAVANNDALKAILEAISKIQVGEGGNVDLSSIETMLAELLKQVRSNGELLSSIDGKVDVINMTINTAKNEILNKLGEGFDKTNQHYKNIEATLNDIVNNAGEGFDDSEILGHLDLILKSIEKIGEKFPDKTDLLAKLDEILVAIKDHKVIVDVTGKVTCECNCGDSGSHEGIVGDLEDLLG